MLFSVVDIHKISYLGCTEFGVVDKESNFLFGLLTMSLGQLLVLDSLFQLSAMDSM